MEDNNQVLAQQQHNHEVGNPTVGPQNQEVANALFGNFAPGPYRPISPAYDPGAGLPDNVYVPPHNNNNNNNHQRANNDVNPRGRGGQRAMSRGRSPGRGASQNRQNVPAAAARPYFGDYAPPAPPPIDVVSFKPAPLTKEAAIWYNSVTNSELPFNDLPTSTNGNFVSMAHQTLVASAMLDIVHLSNVPIARVQVRLNRSFRRWSPFVDKCRHFKNNVQFESVADSSPAHAILAVEDIDWQEVITSVSTMKLQVAYVITPLFDGPFGVHSINGGGANQQLMAWKNTSSGITAVYKPSSGIYTTMNPRKMLMELGETFDVAEVSALGPYKLFRINAGKRARASLPVSLTQCESYSIASLPSTWLGDWFPTSLAPLYYFLRFGSEQRVELIVHSHTLSSATTSLRTPNMLNLTTATMAVESALASAGYNLIATAWPEDHRSLIQDTTLGLLYGGRRQAARGLFSARVAHQHDIDLIVAAGATEKPKSDHVGMLVRLFFLSMLFALAFTMLGRNTRSLGVQAITNLSNKTNINSTLVLIQQQPELSLWWEFVSNWFLSFGVFALVFGVFIIHPLGVIPLTLLVVLHMYREIFDADPHNIEEQRVAGPWPQPANLLQYIVQIITANYYIAIELGFVMMTFISSIIIINSPVTKLTATIILGSQVYSIFTNYRCDDPFQTGSTFLMAISITLMWMSGYLHFIFAHINLFFHLYQRPAIAMLGLQLFTWLCQPVHASNGDKDERMNDWVWISYLIMIVSLMHCIYLTLSQPTKLRVKSLTPSALDTYITSIKMAEPNLPVGFYQMPENFVVPSVITPLKILRDGPKMRGTLKVNGKIVQDGEVPDVILAAYAKDVRPDDCYYPLVIPARVMLKPAAHTISRYAAIRFRIARDPHPVDFDWDGAVERMKTAARQVANWLFPIQNVPSFEESIENMPSERKFVMRKFMQEVERGEQKREAYGGCHPKLDETIWKAVPRAISTPPLEWSLIMLPYVRAITDRTKEVMNIRNIVKISSPALGDLHVRIVFASAHTLQELERDMADAIAREQIITIFIAGDDSIMFHHPIYGWIEGDYSQYDITQRKQCIETLFILLTKLQTPLHFATLEYWCRTMNIKTREKDGVSISFSHDHGDAALSTGQFTTTWGNGMNNTCALISMLLTGEEPVESARKCGFILKTRELNAHPMGFTFLKTFFIFADEPAVDGVRPLIGLPLPGMVWLKLGKVSTDPCRIFHVNRRRDAYKCMANSILQSLIAIPDNTPLLGAFLRLMARMAGSSTPIRSANDFVESPHNPLYSRGLKKRRDLLTRERWQVYIFIENRYHITREAVDEFERELEQIQPQFPLVISHPVIDALSFDYS